MKDLISRNTKVSRNGSASAAIRATDRAGVVSFHDRGLRRVFRLMPQWRFFRVLGQLVGACARRIGAPRIFGVADVAQDREQPGLDRGSLIGVKMPERAQITFLHGVVGIRRVAQQIARQRIDGVEMRQRQLTKPPRLFGIVVDYLDRLTALYDGIWRKPHDPGFIKNASIDDTKAALAKAGMTTEYVPIPLTVVVLKLDNRLIMVDAGSGVGQWQPTAVNLPANMKAAGIDPANIGTILISHFHPDHIFGLMEKDTNAPVYPNAELVVNATEYNWWTEAGRVEKLPEARKPLGQRINSVFPTWKNFKLVEGEKEVAPGVRLVDAPGHTPGHSAFLVSSGNQQLMISNDTA